MGSSVWVTMMVVESKTNYWMTGPGATYCNLEDKLTFWYWSHFYKRNVNVEKWDWDQTWDFLSFIRKEFQIDKLTFTIFHFKSTYYLARVEVYLRVRSGWVLSLLHLCQPETSKKRLQLTATDSGASSLGKFRLAVWPSFYQIKEWQTKFLPIRRTKTKMRCLAALVT